MEARISPATSPKLEFILYSHVVRHCLCVDRMSKYTRIGAGLLNNVNGVTVSGTYLLSEIKK